MDLCEMSDSKLLKATKDSASNERQSCLIFLRHLAEIDKRKLFLQIGFSSLFDYLTRELNYSESAAYRRIQAARLMIAVPSVEAHLASGGINLSVAAKLQDHWRNQAKLGVKVTPREKVSLIESVLGKPCREVEKEILKIAPEPLPKESFRWVDENHLELKVVVTKETKEKLDKLLHLLSHIDPGMSYGELIEKVADLGRHEWDPAFQKTKRKNLLPTSEVNSRYIPRSLKQQVWRRDQGRCTYKDPKSGRLCSSRHLIQIDHIHPYALGGKTIPENLRLLCAAHNQWRSAITFQRHAGKIKEAPA